VTHGHTKESLVAFEDKVAAAFEAKQIAAPVHLCSDSQAEPLISIFKMVRPRDWFFGTWRNHFHCLLKGMPEDELLQQILEGRSMFVASAEHRIVCSAIVGGILPLALGVAMAVRRTGGDERVFVAVGDMAMRTGLFHEFVQYAEGHGLPIVVIGEDNGYSTDAPTEELWGTEKKHLVPFLYKYQRNRPHVGTGKRVQFF
jgi:TPP-dependent pyruvate/acetoin dehydrogenase alpha subunit